MKNQAVILDASRDGKKIKIGIRREEMSVWSYEYVSVEIPGLEKYCCALIEIINSAGRVAEKSSHALEKLKKAGQMLANELLPASVKKCLADIETEYLILQTDDQLVQLPWELLCVGDHFLCEKFIMGRLVETRQKIEPDGYHPPAFPMKMWILANPGKDLKNANLEAAKICEKMDSLVDSSGNQIVEAEIKSSISLDEIKSGLTGYDFVHFAGHADFADQEPENSGWRLSKNDVFRAADIYKMRGGYPMPMLVFSNACQSARTSPWKWTENIETTPAGLANAFMLTGVRHYIGTSWDIGDQPGSHFADKFYQFLLSGMSVGESVYKARHELLQSGDEICWSGYVLYGDPRHSYFSESSNITENIPEKKTSVIIKEIKRETEKGDRLSRSQLTDDERRPPVDISDPRPVVSEPPEPAASPVMPFSVISILMLFFVLFYYWEKQPLNSGDEWTSKVMCLAVVFDEQLEIDNSTARQITTAIESALLKECPRIMLVERMAFTIIQKEISLWKTMNFDPAHTPEEKLLPAHLILYFEKHDEDIEMKLWESRSGKINEVFHQKLEKNVSVFQQKMKLVENLLKTLKKIYPVQGRIIKGLGQEGILNIGSDVGINFGTQFEIKDRKIRLQVVSLKRNECRVHIQQGSGVLQEGWQVQGL